jgi:hypothetical protein
MFVNLSRDSQGILLFYPPPPPPRTTPHGVRLVVLHVVFHPGEIVGSYTARSLGHRTRRQRALRTHDFLSTPCTHDIQSSTLTNMLIKIK